nr:cytochrome c oxidase subunit II [Rhizobium sp. CG5]
MKRVPGDRHGRTRRLFLDLRDDRVLAAIFHQKGSPFRLPTPGPPFRFLALFGLSLFSPLLAGCQGDLSALDAAGPSTAAIARLWWAMLAGAAVIFGLVMALLCVVFFARDKVKHISPQRWIVLGGIVMPVPILLALLGYAFYQGETLFGDRVSDAEITVVATSRMWTWDFAYELDGRTVTSRDILHLPVGRPVRIETTSVDVIHSFWVPRLGGKIDSIPGQVNAIVLQADVEGTFGGICSEYCGVGHAGMTFRVTTHSVAEFENTLKKLGP